MGNLCSCASSGDDQNAQTGGTTAGTNSAPKVLTPQDVIDQSLNDAKRELEKNKGLDFHDKYKVSKLVGHGAFAKVMVCSHKDTHEKYAVKTVQKNLEDPQKQRDGELELREG